MHFAGGPFANTPLQVHTARPGVPCTACALQAGEGRELRLPGDLGAKKVHGVCGVESSLIEFDRCFMS